MSNSTTEFLEWLERRQNDFKLNHRRVGEEILAAQVPQIRNELKRIRYEYQGRLAEIDDILDYFHRETLFDE